MHSNEADGGGWNTTACHPAVCRHESAGFSRCAWRKRALRRRMQVHASPGQCSSVSTGSALQRRVSPLAASRRTRSLRRRRAWHQVPKHLYSRRGAQAVITRRGGPSSFRHRTAVHAALKRQLHPVPVARCKGSRPSGAGRRRQHGGTTGCVLCSSPAGRQLAWRYASTLTTAPGAGDAQTAEYDALWTAVRQNGATFEQWETLAKFSLTLVRLATPSRAHPVSAGLRFD